ncbi:MAG TPA: Crp/Fnr family transcriptional regulator [Polyangiaceae bacterium]
MATGQIVEAATIGNEGLVGAQAYLGIDVSLYATHVQVAGEALQLGTRELRAAARRCPELDRVIRSYLTYALRYANQTVACNALHTVEERACRWLLMTHDRVGNDAFPLTHEFFAEMLGTHRQTVSAIASELQRAGLIQYRRGSVRIVNRGALEAASCECYAVTSEIFHQLVGC